MITHNEQGLRGSIADRYVDHKRSDLLSAIVDLELVNNPQSIMFDPHVVGCRLIDCNCTLAHVLFISWSLMFVALPLCICGWKVPEQVLGCWF